MIPDLTCLFGIVKAFEKEENSSGVEFVHKARNLFQVDFAVHFAVEVGVFDI